MNLWGKGEDIAIIEHDMAVHPLHLEELARCEAEACVFADYIATSRTGKFAPELAHRNRRGNVEQVIDFGAETANRVSLGVARIRVSVQEAVMPTPRVPQVAYNDLAWCLSERLDIDWHVHWPAVAHHHHYC